jgi:hypothetical protein
MSDLENRAKPILVPLMRGESCKVTKAQLTTIAQWAVKTALMYEYMRYKEEARYFTAEHRKALYETLAIPPNTLVFAARYLGDSATYQIGGQIPQFPGPKIRAHSTTIAIKEFAVQVFSFRWLPDHDERRISLVLHDSWADTHKVVWPNPEPILWPPRLALDHAGFEAFAERWRGVADASGAAFRFFDTKKKVLTGKRCGHACLGLGCDWSVCYECWISHYFGKCPEPTREELKQKYLGLACDACRAPYLLRLALQGP